MSDIALRVEQLGKQYRLGGPSVPYDTFREALLRGARAPLRWLKGERQSANTFWALHDVSFELKHGEALGIIGRNGAGKSTLLKILSRITRPTRGRVELYGRVGSLLEVGTGFHPELTGRENIFLNGALLGMSRAEIIRKFDEIVAFAELDRFLDTAVKFYSSGMYVRLAFAVAAHLEPEILVVDEVLAVGDVAFQRKSLGKMSEVARTGRTVLFVSHNTAAVKRLCTRAIVLDRGSLLLSSDADSAVQFYLGSHLGESTALIDLPGPNDENAPGTAVRLRIMDAQQNPKTQFNINEPITLEVEFEMFRETKHVIAAVGVMSVDTLPIITYWSMPEDLTPGKYKVRFVCDVPLSSTSIQFAVGLSSEERPFYYHQNIAQARVTDIAVGEQPFRASGAGLLVGRQNATIARA